MTLVNFKANQPDLATGQAATGGAYTCTPSWRRVDGDHDVLPEPVTATLSDGAASGHLDPNDTTWYWIIEAPDGFTRTVTVPDVESINHVDLVDIDPATFLPTASPDAAWLTLVNDLTARVAILEAGGGGSSVVVDATTSVKGIVELATSTEALTGTDTERAVTPAALKAVAETKQPTGSYATAAQGAKADSAVQPGTLAAVATSGSASDLGTGTLPYARIPVGAGTAQVAQGSHTHTLDALSDVDTSGATNGQALTFDDATNSWIPRTVATSSTIEGLPAGSVLFQVGTSTAARPTTRTDLMVLWLTTDGIQPVNWVDTVDIWLNGPAA